MTRQDKIIVTAYHYNPLNNNLSVNSSKYTMRLDVAELMLMKKTIFDISHYKYVYDSGKYCLKGSREFEENLADVLSNDPSIFGETKLIDETRALDHLLSLSDDVEQRHKLPLYYEVILAESINGNNSLPDRNSTQCILLYDFLSGELFLEYLVSIIRNLLSVYQREKQDGAKRFLKTINDEFKVIREIYNDARTFISDMRVRKEKWNSLWGDLMTEAEAKEWEKTMEEHKTAQNILDFMFIQNDRGKKYARQLIRQLKRLSVFFTGSKFVGDLDFWEDEVRIDEKPPICFKRLNELLDEYERGEVSFAEWLNPYISALCKFDVARQS